MQEIFGISREAEGNQVIALFNMSAGPATAMLDGNNFSGDFEDVFNTGIIRLDEGSTVALKPWEYRVYVRK